MKRKLTPGAIASMIVAGASFLASNWDFIGPHVDTALKSSWFVAHPGVKVAVTGIAGAVVLYREWRNRHPAPLAAGSTNTPTTGVAVAAASSPDATGTSNTTATPV